MYLHLTGLSREFWKFKVLAVVTVSLSFSRSICSVCVHGWKFHSECGSNGTWNSSSWRRTSVCWSYDVLQKIWILSGLFGIPNTSHELRDTFGQWKTSFKERTDSTHLVLLALEHNGAWTSVPFCLLLLQGGWGRVPSLLDQCLVYIGLWHHSLGPTEFRWKWWRVGTDVIRFKWQESLILLGCWNPFKFTVWAVLFLCRGWGRNANNFCAFRTDFWKCDCRKMEAKAVPYQLKFSYTTEYEATSFDKEARLLITADLSAPFIETAEKTSEPSLCIIAVIDRSGRYVPVGLLLLIQQSMQSEMPLVKKTLEFLVTQLKSKDSFSLVSFARYYTFLANMAIWLPNSAPQPSTFRSEKWIVKGRKEQWFFLVVGTLIDEVQEEIQKVNATGGTNLSGGLILALEQLTSFLPSHPHHVTSLLVFTDGTSWTLIQFAHCFGWNRTSKWRNYKTRRTFFLHPEAIWTSRSSSQCVHIWLWNRVDCFSLYSSF